MVKLGTDRPKQHRASGFRRVRHAALGIASILALLTTGFTTASASTPVARVIVAPGAGVHPNTVMSDWSDCLYDPISGDTYHAALVYSGYGVYCGKRDVLGAGGFGVRHIHEAHTYRSNTDACIEKVIARGSAMPVDKVKPPNYGKSLSGGGVTAYVIYTAVPTLAPVSERWSVVTAYTNGTGAASADWTGCLAI